MTDDDRFRLLFGPYRTPVFKYGDDAFCELRGDVILCGLTDAPIPGPTGKNRAAGMSRVQYHRPVGERRSQERGTSTSRVRTASMREPCRQATCIAAQLDFPSVAGSCYADRPVGLIASSPLLASRLSGGYIDG
ncbi:MAG TPA: hypothetical protein VKD72_18075 [Gemmataceae bacterium]|nr:hypothetical protein [Gemmataceae bacterium]